MAKKDDKSNSEQNKERRFSQEQYDMLLRCSDKKDMTEWNEWCEDHSEYYVQDVLLEGGNFSNWHLKNVNLGTHRQHGHRTAEVFLSKANFDNAHLEGASFQFSHVEGARFHEAHLEGANLMFAHLNNKVFLLGVHLEDACLQCAELRNAKVCNAHLNRSNFIDSHLQGSEFDNACLTGAKFRKARVSGSTSFYLCEVDRKTDFREVGLDSARINPGTKQLLKYNIRRMNWEDWYKKGAWWQRVLKRLFIQPFWWMSDYGISGKRVVWIFIILALLFAAVYMNWAYWAPSGIVSNLIVRPEAGEAAWHYLTRALIRSVYFSVVTMTTLGFGDMYANKGSIAGHVLLILQVILGYVLLGALITRFAVLFTAGGPAGKFTEERKSESALERKIKEVPRLRSGLKAQG